MTICPDCGADLAKEHHKSGWCPSCGVEPTLTEEVARIRALGIKITPQPEYDALNAFDAENNVEPFRKTAYRIAARYGHSPTGELVDEISHALEDAYDLGVRRGPLIPHPHS